MSKKIIRVAFIGPESSGKTTLCKLLAKRFNTVCVEEHSRTYLNNLVGKNYSERDVVNIYKQQLDEENEKLKTANKILFIDTEFLNGKVWVEHKFGISNAWFEEQICINPYDLYLLTRPDLKWEPDPLRENPNKGDYFFNLYRKHLNQYKLTYQVIEGDEDARLEQAYKEVNKFIASYKHNKS